MDASANCVTPSAAERGAVRELTARLLPPLTYRVPLFFQHQEQHLPASERLRSGYQQDRHSKSQAIRLSPELPFANYAITGSD
jgi:hypothetical protein